VRRRDGGRIDAGGLVAAEKRGGDAYAHSALNLSALSAAQEKR
jgi:hypothetical protein